MRTDQHGANWTEERAALAVKLYTVDGYSCSRVAGVLGQGVTRNAVIGKLHRMGICTERAPTLRSSKKEARSRFSKPMVKTQVKTKSSELRFDHLPLPIPRSDDIGRVRFADLQAGGCKWICNDPRDGAMACGDAQVPGLPYCAGHARRAYQTPEITPKAAKRKEIVYAAS